MGFTLGRKRYFLSPKISVTTISVAISDCRNNFSIRISDVKYLYLSLELGVCRTIKRGFTKLLECLKIKYYCLFHVGTWVLAVLLRAYHHLTNYMCLNSQLSRSLV